MQQPKLKAKEPSEDEEPQELAHFRREWLAELLKKKTDTGTATATSIGGPPVTEASAVKLSRDLWPSFAAPQNYPGPSSQTIAGRPSALSNVSISSSSIEHSSTPLPRTISSAINIYRQAVEHEQRGDLDDALLLYRQAFRMVRRVFRSQVWYSTL
jgi:F-box protein 9